jgi:hypothetical protein
MVNLAQYSRTPLDHYADMSNDSAMLHANWVAAQDTDRFQKLLNAETEDGQYNVLTALLSRAGEKLEKERFTLTVVHGQTETLG